MDDETRKSAEKADNKNPVDNSDAATEKITS